MLSSRYTYLALQLNGLLDQGESLDIGVTTDRVDHGMVFTLLEETYGDRIDLSTLSGDDRGEIAARFADYSAVGGIRKHYLVERNGLAMLVAFCIEGAHQVSEEAARDDARAVPQFGEAAEVAGQLREALVRVGFRLANLQIEAPGHRFPQTPEEFADAAIYGLLEVLTSAMAAQNTNMGMHPDDPRWDQPEQEPRLR